MSTSFESFEHLVAAIRNGDAATLDRFGNLSSDLPTWGEYDGDTNTVWSWDTTRDAPVVLVGTTPDDLEVVTVEQWEAW